MSEPDDATVINLPVPNRAGPGSWPVDDWGRDAGLVRVAVRLGHLCWQVIVDGASHLPLRRGALIVVSGRRYTLAPIVTALALGESTGRAVRFVGRPDVAPFGPLLRRLGGLLDRPDEVRGALRASEVVVIGTGEQRLVAAAIETGDADLPRSHEIGPVEPGRPRRDQPCRAALVRGARGSTLTMPYATAADGTRLHYQVTGRPGAPPVLFIQGLGADKHMWNFQRFGLAWSYRAYALDNRGVGRSDKPPGPYSLTQMADDAVAVLDHAGLDTAHVVGASMGGAIAQIIALTHPQRVRSLTLACTACRNHPWRRELLAGWAEQANARGLGTMTREAARWVIGPRSFRRLMPALSWLGPLAFGGPAHGFTAQVEAILDAEEDLALELGAIDVPTLVVVGNQDILTPRGDSEELADLIPTAELVVISGAAHGLMVEHATTFNRILRDFLGRAESAGHRSDLAGTEAVDRAVVPADKAEELGERLGG